VNDGEALELLEALVGIPSPSGGEGAAVRFLVERLAALGFDAEIDGAGNAVGRLGGAGPRLLLLGHIDTVTGAVPVERRGDRLYGRGTVDAKGPLVAFVAAALRAARGDQLRARVEIVGCVEEEAPSSAGAWFRARGPAPDALLVGEPSGSRAVTLGYKGFLRASLACERKVAHSAGAEPGAAALAARCFVALEEAAERFNSGREALYERILVHLRHFEHGSDGLLERARLDLGLRLPEDLPPEQAAPWLRELAPQFELTVDGGLPAWSGPRTGVLPRLLGRAIQRNTGAAARFLRKTGTADLNVLAPLWGCPAVAYGPGDSSLDHAPDEHVQLAEFSRGVAVLTDFLADPALAELSRR
jgi:LysW-gamma-L-lysine carboxypeptidase